MSKIYLPEKIGGENYIVYCHQTPSGKRYIGITRLPPNRRWDNGRGYLAQVFGRAIKKYGWDNIQHIILKDSLSKEEACELEQYYIDKFKTQNPKYGYNISNGGETNSVSAETRKKLSERHLGKKHPNSSKTKKGHEVTKETRAKLSIAIKNKWSEGAYSPKPLSTETKRKISETLKGHEVSEETKQKQSAYHKEHPSRARKCQCVETGLIYKTCADAERQIKNDDKYRTNIQACCSGIQLSAYGMHWRYVYE